MRLNEKIKAGQFVIIAEMEPPKGVDLSGMLKMAQKTKKMVDAFLIPEMNNAVMRMSSLGVSMIFRLKGLESIAQFNCRDRNRLALQADILSAYAAGVTTIMVVPGQEVSFGDHHQARAVYDLDEISLLSAIKRLESGRDMAGIELLGAPSFTIGATIEAGAPNRSAEVEAKNLMAKKEAGADFFVTPPIFDLTATDPFLKRIINDKARIFPTVLLLKSLGMARYIEKNIPGIFIPDRLIRRLQKSPDKAREGVMIAAEIINELKETGFGGAIIATLGWEARLPEIMAKVRG